MSLMYDAISRTDRAAAIETARQRSLAWLAAMQVPGAPRGVMRISAAQDHARWPGVSLYGTYNGIMCLDLIGGLDSFSEAERAALVAWLEEHRRLDGIVRVPGMTGEAVFKKPDQIGRAHV